MNRLVLGCLVGGCVFGAAVFQFFRRIRKTGEIDQLISEGAVLDHSDTCDVFTATDAYASRFSGTVGDFFNKVEIEYVLDMLKDYSSGNVLDVGGGHARIAVPLVKSEFNVTVTGSDPSCRYRLDQRLKDHQFKFNVCRPNDLPYEDQSFDVVIATRMLSHVESWQPMLREMCRVAKQGIIFDYTDVRSLNLLSDKLLFALKNNYENATRPYRKFSWEALEKELDKCGYTCIKKHRQFLLPMALHRITGNAKLSKFFEMIFRRIGLIQIFGSPVLVFAIPQKVASSEKVKRQSH